MTGPDANEGTGSTRRRTGPADRTADLRDDDADLLESLLSGDHRALARVITRIEEREPGYRGLVSALYDHTGGADVIGVTGAPGAGKSTLVDKLAAAYRDRGDTVGVVAVDPSSPYSGGAVLGDRIRMASNVGDMDVFFRSMSARGQLGGLSMATADAVKALDAFGKDVVLIETVGAGQNEVDVVRTADTVAVLVQPGSGDDVQTLKAGILEIGDVFVVNKADVDGAERALAELEEMVHRREGSTATPGAAGHHGPHGGGGAPNVAADSDAPNVAADSDAPDAAADSDASNDAEWTPEVLGTVAETGEGVAELIDAFDAHATHLRESGDLARTRRRRYAEEIRTLVRADVGTLATEAIDRRGGIQTLADRVRRKEADPYGVAAEIVDPIAACLEDRDDPNGDRERADE
ncbi:methylmalonyl Co-A mutase-associated GTPase MeaB [Halorubrum cibi]|uniref:LAO/AO transport system kinase n=1 Tax=Halorubrum cibi TaxID=413815 RepID=A0A521BK09_9EURY|nr:methylmalonyl Co-A mutase-associated GTPase MeaB [Halorubrum cibi]SMO47484.1 LAO/AO transport system kinase [Halorubrum cibi]